ncbi:MAG: sigma-54 dependent transcriptional regulator [Candidatus Sumerlaeaceae bacterium]|nr:sigma-54 dependent transcriptional regulator [Candidatus Sumerlaeaceae bacterium]
MTVRILIAEDDQSQRFMLSETLSREGYEVVCATDGVEAIERVRAEDFDVALLDIRMPRLDGLDALRQIHSMRPELLVIMITAFGSQESAMRAMKEGAYDYFTKPFNLDELRLVVRRAVEKSALRRQLASLENQLRDRLSFDRLIGQSPPMQRVYELIRKVVATDVTVLITGESGTGKELVAQAIHYHSARKNKPFVSVNCAAIPETLLESELFGYERGAFTGAVGTKLGQFEIANGGTVFLDEIGDMSLALQAKLLRVLQEREIVRVGATKPIRVDIRIIAATNRDLTELVAAKKFREDLFFRLNVIPVSLPPLRERRGDIPLLVNHFISVYNPRLNKAITSIEPAALELLERYPWPGNVRELENVIQRAMILATGSTITVEDLPSVIFQRRSSHAKNGDWLTDLAGDSDTMKALLEDFSLPLQEKVERLTEELEKRIITAALRKANFHRQETADLLKISRKSLHNKMVKYNLFGLQNDVTTQYEE